MRRLISHLPRRLWIAVLAVAVGTATVFGIGVAQASIIQPSGIQPVCCLSVQTFTLVNSADKLCLDSLYGDQHIGVCNTDLNKQWYGLDSTKRLVNYGTGKCLESMTYLWDPYDGYPDYSVDVNPCNGSANQQWIKVTPTCYWWSICLPGFMIQNVGTQRCIHPFDTGYSDGVYPTAVPCDSSKTDQRWSVGQTFQH